MNNSVAELYDSLTHAESFFGWRKPKSTVHKKLDFSHAPSLKADASYEINHLINSLPLGLDENSRILDAGCGHGGTLISLIEKYHCQGIGISLSPYQITTAQKLFPTPRANFLVCNYDDPPNGPFDLIITIESLIHSKDLVLSYQALSSRLTSNGRLLIVEDMFTPLTQHSGLDSHLFPQLLKRHWRLNALYTENEHLIATRKAGLQLCTKDGLRVLDLSECVLYKTPQKIRRAIAISRFVAQLLPQCRLKTAIEAALGGYILEEFYSKKLAAYKLMVFEKSGVMQSKNEV